MIRRLRLHHSASLLLAGIPLFAAALLGSACHEEGPPVLGVALPLSGPSAERGEAIERGVRLAEDRLRREHAEGSFPYDLRLRVTDTGGDPGRAVEQLGELYRGGALAVLGGAGDAEALAMAEAVGDGKRVFLSPTASTARMAGISRHVFRLHPSATREAAKMGAFAAHDLGLETVAILAPKNRFALDLVDAFREPFEDDGERGGRVVEVVRYVPTPGAVPRAVDRALSGSVGGGARSQGVYLAAPEADPAAREVLRELARRDYRGAVLATSAFAARRVLNQIGNQVGRGAEGLLLPRSGFDPESEAPEVREFVEAYRQEYGEDPTPGAAYGYDAVMVLARALEDQGPVPYQLWQGVRGLSDYAGVTGPIRFDERGEVGRFPRVYVVRRGELERVRALDERARNRLARL